MTRKLLALLVLVPWLAHAQITPGTTSGAAPTITAGLTATITLTNALDDGSTGICVIRNSGTSNVTGVTDNSSGTPAWTQANANTWLGGRAVVFYRANVSGGPTQVVVTSTVQTGTSQIHCVEVTGIDNGDPVFESGELTYAATGEGDSTSHQCDVSNSASGRLVIGIGRAEAGPRTWTEGTGVTGWHVGAEPQGNAGLYRVAPDAGPTAIAYTLDTTSTSNCGFVVFNAAAASTALPLRRRR